jgi:hypothetical protein
MARTDTKGARRTLSSMSATPLLSAAAPVEVGTWGSIQGDDVEEGVEHKPLSEGGDEYDDGETSGQNSHATRQLIVASVLCLIFMAGEAVGGYFSGSLAILTEYVRRLRDGKHAF